MNGLLRKEQKSQRKENLRLTVFNRQRKFAVDAAALSEFLEKVARKLDLAPFSVVLVNDAAMRKLNSQFRGKDYPTDVLSFPYQEEEWERSEPYLGDVVISIETAHRRKRGSILEELKTLSLHGVLHLLGYDHEADRGQMARLESKLKKEFRLR